LTEPRAIMSIDRAESYNVNFKQERKLSFWEKLIYWYADSLHSYYETVKNTTYSPFSISPAEAAKYLKKAEKYHAQFSSLAAMFQELKDDEEVLNDIYDHLKKITVEFEHAMDYLSNLSDPVKHAKIKESVGSLYSSNFIED